MGNFSLLLCFIVLAGSTGLSNVLAQNQTETHTHTAKSRIDFYELRNDNIIVKLTNWGASIVSILVRDRYGEFTDIVLGYDTIKEYQKDKTYFGSIVGRVANRIGGARFRLNGKTYRLSANEGRNTLHGGKRGFSDVVWNVERINYVEETNCNCPKPPKPRCDSIEFTYFSKNGEEGFPGDLDVSVVYTLKNNSLIVTMTAEALTIATPVNLAQHTYWNLGGHDSGDILDHEIQIFGSRITLVDEDLIPTGRLARVQGTPYDFRDPRVIQRQMVSLDTDGYDINYALDGGQRLKRAAVLRHRRSRRSLEVRTTAQGLQFYTGDYIENVKGKDGAVYQANAGLCLETQGFPDAVNKPNFPSTIVTPDNPYSHVMELNFGF